MLWAKIAFMRKCSIGKIGMEPGPALISGRINITAAHLDVLGRQILCVLKGCEVRPEVFDIFKPDARAFEGRFETLNTYNGEQKPEESNEECDVHQQWSRSF